MSNNFTMDQINNIQVGKTYTSWKQLCEESGIEYKKGGTSQSYQKKELFRYFDYEQTGRKYTILIKRELPLIKTNKGNKSPYRELLQLLILDLIATDKKGKVSITQDSLFMVLAMVNNDFNKNRDSKHLAVLSKELSIPKRTIDIFYSRHSSRFRDMISGTLNSLQNQFILYWKKTHRMAYNDYTSDELTEHQEKTLIRCKSNIAEHMEKSSEKDIFMAGLYDKFMRLVVKEFNAETGLSVKYFYSTYDILYNDDEAYVDKKRRKIYDTLSEQYKTQLKYDLNKLIVDTTVENVKTRVKHTLFIENEVKLTKKLITIE